MVWLPRNEKQTYRLNSRPQMWPWPWKVRWQGLADSDQCYFRCRCAVDSSRSFLIFPEINATWQRLWKINLVLGNVSAVVWVSAGLFKAALVLQWAYCWPGQCGWPEIWVVAIVTGPVYIWGWLLARAGWGLRMGQGAEVPLASDWSAKINFKFWMVTTLMYFCLDLIVDTARLDISHCSMAVWQLFQNQASEKCVNMTSQMTHLLYKQYPVYKITSRLIARGVL